MITIPGLSSGLSSVSGLSVEPGVTGGAMMIDDIVSLAISTSCPRILATMVQGWRSRMVASRIVNWHSPFAKMPVKVYSDGTFSLVNPETSDE